MPFHVVTMVNKQTNKQTETGLVYKNRWPKIGFVCDHLNTFCMLNLNVTMAISKFGNIWINEKVWLKLTRR